MLHLSVDYARRELVRRCLSGDDTGLRALRSQRVIARGWVSYIFGKVGGSQVWLVASQDGKNVHILKGVDEARSRIVSCSDLCNVPRHEFCLEWARNDVRKDGSVAVYFRCFAPTFARQFETILHPDTLVTCVSYDL